MKLGRIPVFDPRSLNFRAVNFIPAKEQPLVSKEWVCPEVLDQGYLSACVGYAWSHLLLTHPESVKGVDNNFAKSLYRQAQKLDEFPGEDYEGTSVLAGAKALKENYPTLFDSYHWAFGLDEVLQVLSHLGPLTLGVDWYSSMFTPDKETGVLHVAGAKVGGHAVLASGINIENEEVTLHNSWGPTYGIWGKTFIKFNDLKKLLKNRGEACYIRSKSSDGLVTKI